jgi:hypothetical protein
MFVASTAAAGVVVLLFRARAVSDLRCNLLVLAKAGLLAGIGYVCGT